LSRRARAALLVLLAVVLSACTLDLDVHVDVQPDGSGAVEVTAEVDAGALQRIGGDLAAVVDLDRLRSEGWTVDGPTATAGGGAQVVLRQGFDDPDGAGRVLAEVAGPDAHGPFQDLRVTKDDGLFRTRWHFGGTVDLDRGVAVPGTSDDLGALEAQLGDSLDRLLRLRVGVRLPGAVSSNATTKADNGAVWQVRFGEDRFDLDATGRETHPLPYVGLGALGLAGLVGLVALLVRLAGRAAP
jgi:hypothetical protein